jgi:hypothetical protein
VILDESLQALNRKTGTFGLLLSIFQAFKLLERVELNDIINKPAKAPQMPVLICGKKVHDVGYGLDLVSRPPQGLSWSRE